MTYHELLKNELAKRCAANARYSLRAFARDLNMSPSRISQILNYKLGLSVKAAKKMAAKMGLSAAEADYFCKSVEAHCGRSKLSRESAEASLQRRESEARAYRILHLDAFQTIADWHHYALVDLLRTRNAKPNSIWLARRLGISKYETELAIERLKRLELIREEKGKLLAVGEPFTTVTDVPSEAIRKFHKQVLYRAIEALEAQNVDERDITAITAPIAREHIGEYKKLIQKFRHNMNALFDKRAHQSAEVYCLGIQFFRLSEKNQEKKV